MNLPNERMRLGVVLLTVLAVCAGCGPLVRKPAHPVDAKATRLIEAIAANDRTKANILLDAGLVDNGRDSHGVTPLLQAMLSKNKPTFEALLARHASPNLCDDRGRCVMNQSASLEDAYWLETALAHGGNPNALNIGNRHYQNRTPIFYTIMRDKFDIQPWRARNAEILIRAGADINHLDSVGLSPARYAAVPSRAAP